MSPRAYIGRQAGLIESDSVPIAADLAKWRDRSEIVALTDGTYRGLCPHVLKLEWETRPKE